jgi:hypothetical protein
MTKYSQNYKPASCLKNKKSFKLGSAKLIGIGVVIIFVSVVCTYLMQINHIAAKGFELQSLEKEINLVKEENERLGIKVVELKSSGAIQEKIDRLNMVRVDTVSYFNTAGSVVAINK